MLVNRSETLEAYARHLEGDASEIHALYQDCLITVTSFFRDPAVFEALREQVFPVLLKDRAPDAHGTDDLIRIPDGGADIHGRRAGILLDIIGGPRAVTALERERHVAQA
jgi:hypothetical protein